MYQAELPSDHNPSEQSEIELPPIDQLEYPKHDLATASRVLLVLSDPDIEHAYDECIQNGQNDETYNVSFGQLRAVCNQKRDYIPNHTLVSVGLDFCYASVHYETGRLASCLRELKDLALSFSTIDEDEIRLKKYTDDAIDYIENQYNKNTAG